MSAGFLALRVGLARPCCPKCARPFSRCDYFREAWVCASCAFSEAWRATVVRRHSPA